MFQISQYTIPHMPADAREIRIAQVSDVHIRSRDRTDVLEALSRIEPDIVAVTGDLVSAGCRDTGPAERLLRRLVEIAPTYYVFGNHEFAVPGIANLERRATAHGVEVLRNRGTLHVVRGIPLWVAGVDDPLWMQDRLDLFQKNLDRAVQASPPATCCVLLSHRPEHLDAYAKLSVDVVLSGHAHGGQFRLPLVGGLFAPGQGFFPRFTAGVHHRGRVHLVISRGLGDGTFPLRLGNRRELVVVALRCAILGTRELRSAESASRRGGSAGGVQDSDHD